MKRMKFVTLVIASMLVLLTVLMINSTRVSLSESRRESGQTGAVTELNVAHWTNLPSCVLDLFQAENPDIRVNYMQYSKSVYDKAVRTKLFSRSGIDVFGVQEKDYVEFAQSGLLYDLTEEPFMARYSGTARSAVAGKYDGREYAAALSSTCYGMWYNRSIFERLGLQVPQTYEEFAGVCSALKKNGITPMVLGGKDARSADMIYLLRMIEGDGAAEQAREQYLRETEQLIGRGYLYENSYTLTYQQAFEMFKRGQAAMMPAPDYSVNMCGLDMEKVMEPGVFVIPCSDAVSLTPMIPADNLIAVSSFSDKQEQALRFLDFISRSDVARTIAEENGWTSALTSAGEELPYDSYWNDIRESASRDISGFLSDQEGGERAKQLIYGGDFIATEGEKPA